MEEQIIDFYCRRCRWDVIDVGHKRWKNKFVGVVWSRRCPKCNRELIRFTENHTLDPYFRLSRKAKAERRAYANYLIQPGHPDFDKLYPHYKREQEQKETYEAMEAWDYARHKDG